MTQPTPNMAQDLVRIHKVITRAIDVGLIKGKQYLNAGFTNTEELVGYSRYTHSLVEVLDSHHTGEDLIIFPKLHGVLPSAPYARLTAEHHQVERILAVIRPVLESLSEQSLDGLNTIVESLEKLSQLWSPHYQVEERTFSAEAINAVLSLDDQKRISAAASKHSQEHSGPAYWVIPFILYNLLGEDRSTMEAFLPPAIVEELVPKAWKEQWEPMKPLLLD